MSKIFVTGGAGFIGALLAAHLTGKGHDVVVLDNLLSQIHGQAREEDVAKILAPAKFIRGDIRDRYLMSKLLSDCDVVVHLASETGTGQSMYEIERYVDVNSRGTAIMLQLIVNAKRRPSRVVISSSRSIYGEGAANCPQHGLVFPNTRKAEDMAKGIFEPRCPVCAELTSVAPTPEKAPLRPSSVYGLTKLDQERLIMICCKSIGVPAIAVRYQNVYGPGQSLKNPYTGILSIFSTAILAGEPIRIFEDGAESRDFVYVEDVVAATALAVAAPAEISGVFNVGAGRAVSVLEVVNGLQQIYGREVETKVTGEFRIGDIRHNIADLSQIRRLGYAPKWTFEQGLATFCEWVRTQPISSSGYSRSLDEMRGLGLLFGRA